MKNCCYLRIEDVSVGNDTFDHPDYMYICKLFNKRIFMDFARGVNITKKKW